MEAPAVTYRSRSSGKEARVFRPDILTPDDVGQDAETVTVDVDGTPRVLLMRPLRLAKIFNAELEARSQLLHDCGVFALAWLTGDTYADKHFYSEDSLGLNTWVLKRMSVSLGNKAIESVVEPGEILRTTRLDEAGGRVVESQHYLIRVSVDEIEPALYISKLGLGAACVHDLDTSYFMYPADAVQKVTNIVPRTIE